MSGEVFLLIIVIVIYVAAAVLVYWGLKQPYLAIPDDLEFRQVDFARTTCLSIEPLERLATLLEREGFERLGEFGTQFGRASRNQSYFRLYRHEGLGCFATVAQQFASGGDYAPYCRIVSLLEQSW